MTTQTETATKPQHRKERANPDWSMRVYSYWIEPIGDVPEWVWRYHDEMQALWNEMVDAHDAFVENRRASETEAKWDADRRRIEFAGFREQLKNLAKTRKGTLPNSCYYEVRDKFLVSMGRYWSPDANLRRRRVQSNNYDLGRPRKHFGRQRVLIPHDMNAANVSSGIVFAGKKPLTILQRTRQQGPTRGEFTAAGNSFPFRCNLHRPIPASANIKRIAIVGNYVRPFGWEWSLHLTVEEPPRPQAPRTDRIAAIDLGWRLMDDERIRIGVLVDDGGNVSEISLPLDFADNNIRRQVKYFSKIKDAVLPIYTIPQMAEAQEQADFELEDCKDQLKRLIPDLLPNKQAWSKARHKSLIRLLDKLRETDAESPAIKVISDWRRENYRHHRRWRSAYERFLRWRTEAYRVIAAAIADSYDMLIVEDHLNIAEMSQDKDAPHAVKASQRYRHWTATAEFKGTLEYAMKKAGREVGKRNAAYSTATCSSCGADVNTDSPLYLTCANGHTQDQDVNAARNLLQSHEEFERFIGGELPTLLSQITRHIKPLSSLKS